MVVMSTRRVRNVLGMVLGAVKARLVDVAKEARVSVTTASRALGGFDDVSELTRRRVEDTARRLGYVPNISAQRLRRRRTDMIGLILPADESGFGEPFFNEFLAGVGEATASLDLSLLLAAHPPGSTAERDTYLKAVWGGWVDGVILIRLRRKDERVDLLRQASFPFVAFGQTEDNADFSFIDEDSVAGLGLLVDHLAQLGHRQIAFVTGPDELTLTHHRLRGFKEAMTRHRLPVRDRLIASGDLRRESGEKAMSRLMDLSQPPTAVIFSNDMMALGGLEEASIRGLKVGRDVSIAGFDGIRAGAHTSPGLTTVRKPIREIGRQVCRTLMEMIDDVTLPVRHVLLMPELLVRGSTGPVPTRAGRKGHPTNTKTRRDT